jgi:hypothetical protein
VEIRNENGTKVKDLRSLNSSKKSLTEYILNSRAVSNTESLDFSKSRPSHRNGPPENSKDELLSDGSCNNMPSDEE